MTATLGVEDAAETKAHRAYLAGLLAGQIMTIDMSLPPLDMLDTDDFVHRLYGMKADLVRDAAERIKAFAELVLRAVPREAPVKRSS